MDMTELLEWRAKVEKRLAELEALVFESEQRGVPDRDALADLTSQIASWISGHWEHTRTPVQYRLLSARFSKQVRNAGSNLDRLVEVLVAGGQVKLGVAGGRRLLIPIHANLEESQRIEWGFETPEEREAREVNEELRKLIASNG